MFYTCETKKEKEEEKEEEEEKDTKEGAFTQHKRIPQKAFHQNTKALGCF